jgi:hypothetical protein
MNNKSYEKTIFVQLASCEERFLELTVRSALAKAKYPQNIYFGIFNNILKQEHSLLNNDFITKNDQIFYAELFTGVPMGVGFGRMNASLLQFKDFDYMLQVDAHTLFPNNWDDQVISIFNQIHEETKIEEDKIVLSGVPPIIWSYDENDLNKIVSPNPETNTFFEIDPFDLEKHFEDSIKNGLTVPQIIYDGKQNEVLFENHIGYPVTYGGAKREEGNYQEINCIFGSFMFSKANINREVLHDPEDIFNGDQTNYEIRLLSRGYKIFCPRYPSLASLNKYLPEGDDITHTTVPMDKDFHWRTCTDVTPSGAKYFTRKIKDDKDFFNDLISGRYIGYWGAPDLQSLEETKKIINYPE